MPKGLPLTGTSGGKKKYADARDAPFLGYVVQEELKRIHLPSDFTDLFNFFNLSGSQLFLWFREQCCSENPTPKPRPLVSSSF